MFAIIKIGQWKTLPVKVKFGLVYKIVFFFYFGWKTLSKSCEKITNIVLFEYYNKFYPQTFDCYIFCFEFFFQFYHLEFDLI